MRLKSEEVAEFPYRPGACGKDYRMVVIRKNISKEKGEARLLDEVRYYFYITNDWVSTQAEVVFAANDRCNQENLLAQLHSGCHALRAPVDDLVSNWAYMVMTALAWNLKAWWCFSYLKVGDVIERLTVGRSGGCRGWNSRRLCRRSCGFPASWSAPAAGGSTVCCPGTRINESSSDGSPP